MRKNFGAKPWTYPQPVLILVSYDPATCRLVGKIVNVSADEKVLDGDGKIDPDKLQPITFDPIHSAYRKLGEKVGNAFRDGNQLK